MCYLTAELAAHGVTLLMKACVVGLYLMPPYCVSLFTVDFLIQDISKYASVLESTGMRTMDHICLAFEVTCEVLG